MYNENYGNETPNLVVEKEAETCVAVCRTCYGFIYHLSDKISNYCYQLAIKALREVESKFTRQIEELTHRIEELNRKVEGLMHQYSQLVKTR